MTRDELLEDITKAVKEAVPENDDLNGSDLDIITDTINDCVTNACDAIDETEDEEEETT